ncbi:MAG: class II aldolase/adducin family protein [Lachnospiraceae bacterium]|nr:class II aldolase/adducin family protein [Lachnospiraceae bacterium]
MIIQGVYYPSDFEAKKAIIEIAGRMDAKEYAIAGDGSLSVRVGPNAVWITTLGADKGALTQDMLVRVDLNGKQAMSSKPKVLPEDLPIHLKLYGENKEIAAILHGYPPRANACAIRKQDIPTAFFSPAIRALGKITCLDTASMEEIAQRAVSFCRTEHGMLIHNDGCMVWGTSVKEAFQRMEAIECSAGMLGLLQEKDYSQTWDVERKESVVETKVLPGVTPLVKPATLSAPRSAATPVARPEPVSRPMPVSQPVSAAVSQPMLIKQSVAAAQTSLVTQKEAPATGIPREQVMNEVVKRMLSQL